MSEENETVYVSEKKFNATATLSISGIEDKDTVKRIARQYFNDEYGHRPSKVVAEEEEYALNGTEWEVMVADHSSGSLKGTEEYEL